MVKEFEVGDGDFIGPQKDSGPLGSDLEGKSREEISKAFQSHLNPNLHSGDSTPADMSQQREYGLRHTERPTRRAIQDTILDLVNSGGIKGIIEESDNPIDQAILDYNPPVEDIIHDSDTRDLSNVAAGMDQLNRWDRTEKQVAALEEYFDQGIKSGGFTQVEFWLAVKELYDQRLVSREFIYEVSGAFMQRRSYDLIVHAWQRTDALQRHRELMELRAVGAISDEQLGKLMSTLEHYKHGYMYDLMRDVMDMKKTPAEYLDGLEALRNVGFLSEAMHQKFFEKRYYPFLVNDIRSKERNFTNQNIIETWMKIMQLRSSGELTTDEVSALVQELHSAVTRSAKSKEEFKTIEEILIMGVEGISNREDALIFGEDLNDMKRDGQEKAYSHFHSTNLDLVQAVLAKKLEDFS